MAFFNLSSQFGKSPIPFYRNRHMPQINFSRAPTPPKMAAYDAGDGRLSLCFITPLPLTRATSGSFRCSRNRASLSRVTSIRPKVTRACITTEAQPAGRIQIDEVSSENLFSSGGFASLGLSPEMVLALETLGITRPTAVQSRGIPAILSGRNVILGAATGSGKTLAYLLPVVQMLKQAEGLRNVGEAPLRIARRPRAVVVVPTRELALQTAAVAKSLSYLVKFRALTVVGDGPMRRATDALAAGAVDVLVGTTGRLLQLIDARAIDLRFATHIVVDEVDTMLDAGFAPELSRLLSAARKGRVEAERALPQVVAASATHPRAAEPLYVQEVPNALRINARLHQAPAGLTQRFVPVTTRTKLLELTSLLGDPKTPGDSPGGRIVIFCNTMDSVRFLDHYLRERGHLAACVHGDVPSTTRAAEYRAFREGEAHILVCSDCAARGLDNTRVDHVILFDFPTSAVDYLHRAGRTARAGAKGVVTSLVMKRDDRLSRAIQKAARECSDTLESAREAREDLLRQRSEEESRAKEADRKAAAAAWESGGAPIESVPFSSAVRVAGTRTSGRGSRRGRGARGGRRSAGAGSGRGRGGRFGRR